MQIIINLKPMKTQITFPPGTDMGEIYNFIDESALDYPSQIWSQKQITITIETKEL